MYIYIYVRTCTYIHTYIYIYICVSIYLWLPFPYLELPHITPYYPADISGTTADWAREALCRRLGTHVAFLATHLCRIWRPGRIRRNHGEMKVTLW